MFQLAAIVILSLSNYVYGQNLAPANGAININEVQICEEPRRCVPKKHCLQDGTLNIRGVNVIQSRFDGDDSNTLVVGNETYLVSANNTIIQRNGIEARVCHYLENCCGTTAINKIELPSNSTIECGYRNPDGLYFKINTTNKAQYGEFPWMAAVIWHDPTNNRPSLIAGGSLIHPNVILTVAHILSDKSSSEFKVRVGEWDTNTESENIPHQDRNVNKIIRHESYDSAGLLNNYALLIVDQPFVLSASVQPICLPTANLLLTGGQECYSAGWGKQTFSYLERRETILKKIKLPIVPFDACQEQLRKTQLGDIFELHESFLCAGGLPGEDTCTGDGGSPLMCPVPNQTNRYYQTGIVAWGLGCGEKNIPGVYANVGLARKWIDRKMKENGFSTDSYSIR